MIRQKQDTTEIDETVYATITVFLHAGASNRQIRHALRELYDLNLSRSAITRAINKAKRGRIE